MGRPKWSYKHGTAQVVLQLIQKNFMRGSLIHDALYQLMREGLVDEGFFDAANEELRIACLQDGMCKFRAWYIYKGVSLFGKQFAKKQKTSVITAP